MKSNLPIKWDGIYQNGESEIDSLLDKTCWVFQSPTLNLKVENAIKYRKQGDINKAMLNISEANRDQVLAIRKIQRIIDEINDRDAEEVVFSKYHQFFPLEIGIENGNDLLRIIKEEFERLNSKLKDEKEKSHKLELEEQSEEERLEFYQRNFPQRISEEEVKEVESNLERIKEQISIIKLKIMQEILLVSKKNFSSYSFNDGSLGIKRFLELSWNLFSIYMSPILTKQANLVRIEKQGG